METISKTYRLPENTINQIKRLEKYYNRSATDIVCIAISNMYCEMPELEPKEITLLEQIKILVNDKYKNTITEYVTSHGFTKDEFYRTLKTISRNKNIRGFGSDDKRNKSRDNKDKFYSTITAQITMLLFEDFGIDFNL
ncbi:MAG: hypothetical protein JZU65_05725 [Chlorobium sp.]|nr:hypothetical protein [Chlorobium sp.]